MEHAEQRARWGGGGRKAERQEPIAWNTYGVVPSKGLASFTQVQHAGSDTGRSFPFLYVPRLVDLLISPILRPLLRLMLDSTGLKSRNIELLRYRNRAVRFIHSQE